MESKKDIFEYINREMDRILLLPTRDKQNRAFEALTPPHPIKPIKMTLTTCVFLYQDKESRFVLKRIIYNKDSGLEEGEMSMSLRHKHVIQTLKTFKTSRIKNDEEEIFIWIMSEYLEHKISMKEVNRNEHKISQIIKGALEGLQYLHSRRIAHLDLKIANLMGRKTKKGIEYVLIDFGYSMEMNETLRRIIPHKSYGTFPYKPPETISRNEHGIKSDIWTIGAITYYLSKGYTPFYKKTSDRQKDMSAYKAFIANEEVNDNGIPVRFKFERNTSQKLKDFVIACMKNNPIDRPTASELLGHPFLNDSEESSVFSSETSVTRPIKRRRG